MKEKIKKAKKAMPYLKEFFFKRGGTLEEPTYQPNTRKFWATISWVLLLIWLPTLMVILFMLISAWIDGKIKIGDAPWGTLISITSILIGNAQMAIGWYSFEKHGDKMNGLYKTEEKNATPTKDADAKGTGKLYES